MSSTIEKLQEAGYNNAYDIQVKIGHDTYGKLINLADALGIDEGEKWGHHPVHEAGTDDEHMLLGKHELDEFIELVKSYAEDNKLCTYMSMGVSDGYWDFDTEEYESFQLTCQCRHNVRVHARCLHHFTPSTKCRAFCRQPVDLGLLGWAEKCVRRNLSITAMDRVIKNTLIPFAAKHRACLTVEIFKDLKEDGEIKEGEDEATEIEEEEKEEEDSAEEDSNEAFSTFLYNQALRRDEDVACDEEKSLYQITCHCSSKVSKADMVDVVSALVKRRSGAKRTKCENSWLKVLKPKEAALALCKQLNALLGVEPADEDDE